MIKADVNQTNDDEEEEFTPVVKHQSGSKRTSAMFTYMDTCDWQHLLPDGINTKGPTVSRRYFLIELDPKAVEAIYDPVEYELYNRHIRVDEVFGTDNSKLANVTLCSQWHYKESYRKISDPNYIIHLRSYFNYGRSLSVYIRENNTPKTKVNSTEMLNSVEQNSQSAKMIINDIMAGLSDARTAAAKNFESFLRNISNPNLELYRSHAAMQIEMQKGKAASDAFNRLNESGEIDCRYQLLAANIEKIMQRNKATEPELEPEQKPTETASTSTTVSTKNLKSKATTTAKNLSSAATKDTYTIPQLEKELPRLEKAYLNASPNKILDLEAKKDKLQIEICVSVINNKDPAKRKKLQLLGDKLNKLRSSLDYFLEAAMNGNVSAVMKLYNHVQTQIPNSFYLDFFKNIIKKGLMDSELELRYAEILAYLYKKSSVYRMFISFLPAVSLNYKTENNTLVSKFIPFILAQNFKQLFKLCIEQWGNRIPNTIGFAYKQYKVALAICIASFATDDDFLDLVLEKSYRMENNWFANPQLYKEAGTMRAPAQLVKNSGMFFSQQPVVPPFDSDFRSNYQLKIWACYAPVDSVFYAYCNNPAPKSEILQRLAATSSDFNLALGYAKIMSSARCIIMPSSKGKTDVISVYTDNNQRESDANTHIVEYYNAGDNPIRFKIFYLLYGDYLDAALSMSRYAIERFEKMSEQQLIPLAIQLEIFAQQQYREQNFLLAMTAYNAKFLVLNYELETQLVHEEMLKTLRDLIRTNDLSTDRTPEQKMAYSTAMQLPIDFFMQKHTLNHQQVPPITNKDQDRCRCSIS